MTTITCRRCGSEMKAGKALQNTLAGIPDFPGDTYACTVSETGPAKLVTVLKCVGCGYSLAKKMLNEMAVH